MYLINFGFNPWSHYWKRNQTLFYLLSQADFVDSALFVNSNVWLSDLVKSPTRLAGFVKSHTVEVGRRCKVSARTPLYLPLTRKLPMMQKINSMLNNYLVPVKDQTVILMVNDLQADVELVQRFRERAALTIFDWSDDFIEFSSNESERLRCKEKCDYWCTHSDIVLTINEDLKERARSLNANSHAVRNATNFFTFANAGVETESSKRLRTLGGVIVGYIGWLNSMRLDLDIIKHVAESRPQYQFVFLGPRCDEMPLGHEIPRMKNVHVLPPVPYEEYPACLKALDVCILPNLINQHTQGNDPIKIYDYLASGRPIVATKTAGTGVFADLLYLADDGASFLHMLDAAVLETCVIAQQARIEAARQNSWQERFKQVQSIILPFLKP